MHVYLSGIGGAAISAAARLGYQAGFTISGSDKQDGAYIHTLKDLGVTDIHLDQTYDTIASVHKKQPIDWFVYSSAITMEQADPAELKFCREQGIRTSKRDEFLNMLLDKKHQKLIAIAGTHGKSTTTAMVIWLFKELNIPISYATGAKIPFGPLADFNQQGQYFVYECDEFDRNFLAFKPTLSAITGLAWDHHEIFPTRDNYNQAFRDFIAQSAHTIMWQHDAEYAGMTPSPTVQILQRTQPDMQSLTLPGQFTREDAWLAVQTVQVATGAPIEQLIGTINRFPGLTQRMELLAPNLYTNYAHTPEKIKGGLSTAFEIAGAHNQQVVVVYEPLTNRRQHYIKDEYANVFANVAKLYWVPSYLAREDPNLPVLTPAELITYMHNKDIAEPAALDDTLLSNIKNHLRQGDLVVAMGASGTGSLDQWLRSHFDSQHTH